MANETWIESIKGVFVLGAALLTGTAVCTIERKRRVVVTEVKRAVMTHDVLTEERAYELLRWLLTTLKTHVTDRKILGAIATDFERVLGSEERFPPPFMG